MKYDSLIKIAHDYADKNPYFRHLLVGGKYDHLPSAFLQMGFDPFNPPEFPLIEPPPQEGIKIGNVLDGERICCPFYLPYKSLLSGHSAFVGATSTGKSTLLMCIILPALISSGKKVIVWDTGRQYASVLCSIFPPEKVTRFTPREFKLNPLTPPGRMRREEWRERFASLLRIFDVGSGMINLFKEAVTYAYSNYSNPCLLHVRERIKSLNYKHTERHFNWRESLLDKLEYILSVLGEGFICEKGFMQSELNRSIIFDMEGCDPILYAFYMDLINERLLYGQKETFSTEAEIIEVVEEAHIRLSRDALARRATEVGERPILTHIRVMRKVGVSFIFVDQAPHLLPEQLFANILTWFVFQLKDAQSLYKIQQVLNLDEEQKKKISKLPRRRVVVFSQI